MVCDSCHSQGVPLRLGLLSLAIIPARKSNVQCCFAPSAVRVVCTPARLQYSDPIIAEHNDPYLYQLESSAAAARLAPQAEQLPSPCATVTIMLNYKQLLPPL